MSPRKIYNRDLREAIDKVLVGRNEIWIADLALAIYGAGFQHEKPSPSTLAKLLTGRGWIKTVSNMPGTLYVAPPQQEQS